MSVDPSYYERVCAGRQIRALKFRALFALGLGGLVWFIFFILAHAVGVDTPPDGWPLFIWLGRIALFVSLLRWAAFRFDAMKMAWIWSE